MTVEEGERWAVRFHDLGWSCLREPAPLPPVRGVELTVMHPTHGLVCLVTERQCVEMLWQWYWGRRDQEGEHWA